LWAGAAAAIAPWYIWILGWHVQMSVPYSFVWTTLAKFLPSSPSAAGRPQVAADYIAEGRKLVPLSQQWPIVLRYYLVLILPIALAAGSIVARFVRMIVSAVSPGKIQPKTCDRFVLLLAVWWILDMAFVWISPASYEQYYLPLNASAAMLGGYLIAIYVGYLKESVFKIRPMIAGLIGLAVMIIMSWHIFAGIAKSPYTGTSYGGRQRGYVQKLEEISRRQQQKLTGYAIPWEAISDYIRAHSQPTDRIYVWGWYPGIYLRAQRFSAASAACCMPRPAPQVLSQIVAQLLDEFNRRTPRFIVDSRKRHVPTDRPPYELWPVVWEGFMGAKKTHFLLSDEEERYDAEWGSWLRKKFDDDEVLRYEALKLLREFVMNNYRIVSASGGFGEHVLFELKTVPVSMQSD
jgi:hypothetical protein